MLGSGAWRDRRARARSAGGPLSAVRVVDNVDNGIFGGGPHHSSTESSSPSQTIIIIIKGEILDWRSSVDHKSMINA